MKTPFIVATGLILAAHLMAPAASGQAHSATEAIIDAQQEAMKSLAAMDGEWRGSAWMLLRSGEKETFTQTERVGPFLDKSVKVVEGRGYGPDGGVQFNALGVVSYDPTTNAYSMRSYAQGRAGEFVLTPTANGFQWEIPAGPATIRYTAVIDDSVWHEVGDRLMPDKEPVRFFEMTLNRVGDTDWPSVGAVGPE